MCVFFSDTQSSCGRPSVTQQRETLRLAKNGDSVPVSGGAEKDRKSKTGVETQRKSRKRKQVDCEQQGNQGENQPPQKKSVAAKAPGKAVGKGVSKKKLIAGQGKLTSFFRL